MLQEITPIAVRPSTLSGISEHMVVSHYENDYGNAVRELNAVRRELAALDAGTPSYRLRGLKREELSLMGSVTQHELYFGNRGTLVDACDVYSDPAISEFVAREAIAMSCDRAWAS